MREVLDSILNDNFVRRYCIDDYILYGRGSERILYDSKRDKKADQFDVRVYQTEQKPLPRMPVQRELSNSISDLFDYGRSEKPNIIKEGIYIFLTSLSLLTIAAAGGYVAALTIKSFLN